MNEADKGKPTCTVGGWATAPVDSLVKPDIVERLEFGCPLLPLGTYSGKDGTAAEVVMLEASEEIKRLREDREWQIKQNVKMFEALQKIERGVMCYTNLEIREMVKEAMAEAV